MTKQEVIKVLALIEAVYSYCITKDVTVTDWFEYCAQMDYEKVIEKLCSHIRKSPYPPAIADLVENNDFSNWSKKGRERITRDGTNGNRNPLPEWMQEYSPKKMM